jgi:hypothetical protein
MRRFRIGSAVGMLVFLVLLIAAVKGGLAASRQAGLAEGISGWEIVTADTALENVNVQIGVATCPFGKQVLGGGYLVYPDTSGPIGNDLRRVAVVDSHPFPEFPAADSWRVRAIRQSPSIGAWQMRVYVICAPVAP